MPVDVRELRDQYRPVPNDEGGYTVNGVDFSGIDMYLRCAMQYKFRYIGGQKSPPGIAMLEGTSHHFAVEMDNKSKLEKGRSFAASDLTDLFVAKLRDEVPKAEAQCDEAKAKFDWEGEDEESLIVRAKTLHLEYATTFSPKIKPVGVEETFAKKVPGKDGFILFGAIDLGEKDQVTDYKVVGRVKTEKDAQESLQLSIYSWAFQKKWVRFISFVKTKNPYVAEAVANRTKAEQDWAIEVVKSAVDGIRRGAFPLVAPSTMNWVCQPRFCGYWDQCRGRKR